MSETYLPVRHTGTGIELGVDTHKHTPVLRGPGLLSSADGVPACGRLLFPDIFRHLNSFTASLYTYT